MLSRLVRAMCLLVYAKLEKFTCEACTIMRSNVDPHKIEQLMKALGREARGSGCIYFTGGASALLIGWRSSTVDIDIRLDPEPPGIFQALAKLKQQLDINIELASP